MRRALATIALGFVCGCSVSEPTYLVHKTGSTYAARMRALDQCEFEAIQAVPRAMATEVSGGYFSPGSVQCTTVGGLTNCNRVGGVSIPASSTTYDANADIRHRYMGRCIEGKGYALLARPSCTKPEDIARFQAGLNNQPAASAITCSVANR